jgi:transposase
MKDPTPLEQLSREELIALVEALQAQNRALQEQVKALRDEIETLKRGQHRQAAPFSKGERKADPKPPGRKKGVGPFTFRRAPQPEELTAPPIEVPVTRTDCPACGGALVAERTDLAYVTDLPEIIRPAIRSYRVAVCRCAQCGERVRGEHPDLAPDQWGATAHRLGPRVKAAAHVLHYDLGVPERKVPEILALLGGITVTQSALTQDALKQSEGAVGTVCSKLKATVKAAPAVNTDDTGWRVGGEPAFLMAFTTDEVTVYQIRERHTNAQVREVIPADYPGVMGCDRGTSYDAQELRDVRQQKCLRHVARSLEEELERDPGNAFAQMLKERVEAAHALWRAYRQGKIDRETYDRQGAEISRAVSVRFVKERVRLHFASRCRSPEATVRDQVNRRLVEGIGEVHARGHLLRFLDDPTIEPTNNRAERALRGAVIARKVSHCSKTERGAEAYAAFVSVIRTARQVGRSVIDALVRLQVLRLVAHAPT